MAETLVDHPNAHLIKKESLTALELALANPRKWVTWQTGFPHARASKTQAYRLRTGQRQKLLTENYLTDLEFRAFKDDEGNFTVIARYSPPGDDK